MFLKSSYVAKNRSLTTGIIIIYTVAIFLYCIFTKYFVHNVAFEFEGAAACSSFDSVMLESL